MIILLSFIFPLLLELVTRFFWTVKWQEREITLSPRVSYSVLRVAGGSILGTVFALLSGMPESVFIFSAVGWLVILVTETDLRTLKIPREPCWVVFFIGTVLGLSTWTLAGAASAGLALIALGGTAFLIALVSKGGLGSGDVRFLVALSPLAWWVGATPLLVGVLIGCILQIILRIALKVTRRNIQYLPFGPALGVGVVSWTLISAASISSQCQEFGLFFPC